MNAIKSIKKFQQDRLLDKQEFNDYREIQNIIEEVYESIGIHSKRATEMTTNVIMMDNKTCLNTEKVDAYADIIVFAVGAIMKLGYEPELILKEVAKEIHSRTGTIIDGKWMKNKNVETYKANFKVCKL